MQTEWIADDLVTEIRARLQAGKRVRRTLPDAGRLHIDRPLPFLCLYRQPVDRIDAGTDQLIKGEAAFLTATAAKPARSGLSALVGRLTHAMTRQFGAFLMVEIWSGPDRDVAVAADRDDMEPTELRPNFVVAARSPNVPQRTVAALCRSLRRISILKQYATVTMAPDAPAHPPQLSYLLKEREAVQMQCATIGICIRPIYRDYTTGELYPLVLRALKRGVSRALQQTFFTFAKTRTNIRPEHYYALGRRAMVKAVWDADRRLSQISDSFDFLLQVTPVNAEAAWREFRRNRFEVAPRFYYRPLAVEPATLKRRLYEIPIERIEDPTLAELFHLRQDELDRKITMLTDIGTPRFLLGSRQIYGSVTGELLTLARQLLDRLPARSRAESTGGVLSAAQFADHARREIDYYRAQLPSFSATAMVRHDLFSGLLCSGGHLLIGHQTRIPVQRVQALLQHEVGTHLLTYYNGLVEPFQQLHAGLAGYDALQEGLAVLGEYLVGGLSSPRLRMLAARVVAAQALIEEASFTDTFRLLERDCFFPHKTAYTITMRCYRGGGLTKDAVYLRGLVEILAYLKRGGPLEPLFIGKIAAQHLPLIQELQLRRVLHPPALQPRYLTMPGAPARLARLRSGLTVFDLIGEERR